MSIFLHAAAEICERGVTTLQPFGKKLMSFPHGHTHTFAVFSREAFWLSFLMGPAASFLERSHAL